MDSASSLVLQLNHQVRSNNCNRNTKIGRLVLSFDTLISDNNLINGKSKYEQVIRPFIMEKEAKNQRIYRSLFCSCLFLSTSASFVAIYLPLTLGADSALAAISVVPLVFLLGTLISITGLINLSIRNKNILHSNQLEFSIDQMDGTNHKLEFKVVPKDIRNTYPDRASSLEFTISIEELEGLIEKANKIGVNSEVNANSRPNVRLGDTAPPAYDSVKSPV